MIIQTPGFERFDGPRISVRCPGCGVVGTFEPYHQIADILTPNRLVLGHRRCPNPACLSHVFLVLSDGAVLRMYPAETIDFNTAGIPASIVKTFSDALICQSEKLYVAAAIMIRRTLEELCEDRKATGNSLKQRIIDASRRRSAPNRTLRRAG